MLPGSPDGYEGAERPLVPAAGLLVPGQGGLAPGASVLGSGSGPDTT